MKKITLTQLDCGSQFGGTAPRVGSHLVVGRGQDVLEEGFPVSLHNCLELAGLYFSVVIFVFLQERAFAIFSWTIHYILQVILDYAILQRMERDGHDAASLLESVPSKLHGKIELIQLVVDQNPQRLLPNKISIY